MPYVFIPDGWGPDRTKLMNQYIIALVELLTLYEGPDELGLVQIMDEMNADQGMFQAVWAHLYTWQRNLLIDIRARHDQRRKTGESSPFFDYHGRALRRTKG
jgi:hypothetical protein